MHESQIFSINSASAFESAALDTFAFQYENVPVYRQFCTLLNVSAKDVNSLDKIPYLPIQFFKSHTILPKKTTAELTFSSSGTTGSTTSKHHVLKAALYEQSFLQGFQRCYGNPSNYVILALLPSYLERQGSSLVYMANSLIEKSGHSDSGFYLNNLEALTHTIERLEKIKQPTILIGVSYALLDLIERNPLNLNHTIVMETGGMKGRRKEMIKEELHHILKKGFGVTQIHSEYGMTELLSQAYSKGEGVYHCPPWMRVSTRDTEDPLQAVHGKTGGINVIDLANRYSCSFIATDDLGRVASNGSFKILGRFDSSDIRGCNLMVL